MAARDRRAAQAAGGTPPLNARIVPVLSLVLPALCLLGLAAKLATPFADSTAPRASRAPAPVPALPSPFADPLTWNEAASPVVQTVESDGRTESALAALVDQPGTTGTGSSPVQAANRPVTADQLAALTAMVAGDLDAYWEQALLAEGRYYRPAEFVLVAEVTPTPCARDGTTAPGAGSFYCPWNETVYLDLPALSLEASRYGEAGLVFTLAHEWGHHAQFQRGHLLERSAAVELAADCLAGAYMAHAVARGRIAADVVERDLPTIVVTLGDAAGVDPGDDQAHGTADQRLAMLLLGYGDGLAGCGA